MNMDRNTAIQLGGLAAGLSTIFTGNAVGLDDQEVADNIFAGQRIGSNAAANNALQVMAQKVPPSDKSHVTIVHTPEPEEQARYANKEGYVQDKETGNWYRTWGAGPENFAISLLSEVTDKASTNLVSNSNRTRDQNLSIKTYISSNLVPIEQETRYVSLLNQLDGNYLDNIKYGLFPTFSNDKYNSNSYVSGLLSSAGINPPNITNFQTNYQWQPWEYDNSNLINLRYNFPIQIPGYNKPVPIQYFQPNREVK